MPGFSPTAGPGEMPGLELKAWALIVPGTGVAVKSFGVASVSRSGAGVYVITPSVAFNAQHLPAVKHSHPVGSVIGISYAMGAALTVTTTIGGTPTDLSGMLYVAVYG